MEHSDRPIRTIISEIESPLVADGSGQRLDRILAGLSRPRCRRVLYALVDEEPLTLDEVARAVVEQETGTPPTSQQFDVTRTRLYHKILPRLADLGLIEYDQRTETVSFRNPPPELQRFLRLCRQLDTEG